MLIACREGPLALPRIGVPNPSKRVRGVSYRVPSLHRQHISSPALGSPIVVKKAVCRTALTEAPPSIDVEAPDSLLETVVLEVSGMKCGGCSAAAKRILGQQPGVAAAAVNLLTATAVIQITPTEDGDTDTIVESAAAALTAKGFPTNLRSLDIDQSVVQAEATAKKEQELRENTQNLALAWTLAVVCYAHHLGHLLHELGLHEYAHTGLMEMIGNPFVSGTLGAAAILGPGRSLLVDGMTSLFRGNPNMNSLIALGASTSFTAGVLSAFLPGLEVDPSFLEEPVMLLAFVLLGRSLEARARAQASGDLSVLANLIPADTRLVLDAGAAAPNAKTGAVVEEIVVPTSTIRAGDVFRVLPGERIPADGEVVDGRASVDQSMLTGETKLIPIGPSDPVTGGTVSYEAPIVVRATSTGSSSRLANIARLVEEAQSREAPVQRLADVVAGVFCFGVMSASAVTFAFWYLAGASMFPSALDVIDVDSSLQAPLLLSIKLAIDVLVVACPCALGLATPTAVLVGSSAGARRGLLIRGGDVLERLAAIDTVVFDKTGTLTEGKLRVADIQAEQGFSSADVLKLAAAVERSTRHPLADAIVSAAEAEGLDLPSYSNSITSPGDGVTATVDGSECYVGRDAWVLGQIGVAEKMSESNCDSGSTKVLVGKHGTGLVGSIKLNDTIRSDAAAVVAQLGKDGVTSIVLSGDEQSVAESIAKQAGIEARSAYGGIRPEDKASFVDALRAEGKHVAMVGDGVNDSIALSAAEVGIAMKSGTDAAGEASDVVLMGDSLSQVLDAISLGKQTLGKIKQNLGLAILYNAVGIPVAAGALLPAYGVALSPAVAAGMMALSSIGVVTNSLLLRNALLQKDSDY